MASFLTLAIFQTIGPVEIAIIGIVALLLFGRRLPEVMRNLGKGIVEFKRGVRGIEDQVDQASALPPQQPRYEHPAQPAQPQPTSQPAQQASPSAPNPPTTEQAKPMA